MNKNNDSDRKSHCCFCRYFELTGYRWGYCKLLGTHMRGDSDACKMFVPPFSSQYQLENIDS